MFFKLSCGKGAWRFPSRKSPSASWLQEERGFLLFHLVVATNPKSVNLRFWGVFVFVFVFVSKAYRGKVYLPALGMPEWGTALTWWQRGGIILNQEHRPQDFKRTLFSPSVFLVGSYGTFFSSFFSSLFCCLGEGTQKSKSAKPESPNRTGTWVFSSFRGNWIARLA